MVDEESFCLITQIVEKFEATFIILWFFWGKNSFNI